LKVKKFVMALPGCKSIVVKLSQHLKEMLPMTARMPNAATLIPEANEGIQTVMKGLYKAGAPRETLELVHLRTSQINGCSFCVLMSAGVVKNGGEAAERLFAVSAWRETSFFTDAERAALALAESMTRVADRSDAVPDEIYNEAAKYYDEKALAAIILMVAMTNLFNRINVTIRQPAGEVNW
jgi:AhpD family alkylhydroperoxidase